MWKGVESTFDQQGVIWEILLTIFQTFPDSMRPFVSPPLNIHIHPSLWQTTGQWKSIKDGY